MSEDLQLFPCSHALARFAVLNYHYSRVLPAGKLYKVGVKENGQFIGVVIFSRGANKNMAVHFGLEQTQLAELARVALTKHKTPVSRILKIAIKLFKKDNAKIKLIFSYADETNQGHKGGIYKADNWLYLGKRIAKSGHLIVGGRFMHNRSISAKWGGKSKIPKNLKVVKPEPQVKHLFIKFLCDSSKASVARRFHLREGGATPTESLKSPGGGLA